MRLKILVIWAISLAALGSSQLDAESSTWARIVAHWGYDISFASAAATSDGGCIIAGRVPAFGGYWYDGWIAKLNASGTIGWQKTFGGPGIDGFLDVIQAKDGGYLAAGYREWNSTDGGGGWCIKLDQTGARKWERTFPKLSIERVRETPDHGFLVAGWTSDGTVILKLDGEGDLLTQRKYSSQQHVTEIRALVPTADGGCAILTDDKTLLKIDSFGEPQWFKQYLLRGEGYAEVSSLALADDGGYVAFGINYYGMGAVVRLDASGEILWSEQVNNLPTDSSSVFEDADGSFVLAGGGQGVFLIRLDGSGGVMWAKRYRVSGDIAVIASGTSAEGGILLAGARSAYDFHSLLYANGFALRTAADGSIDACEGLVKTLDVTAEPLEGVVKTLAAESSSVDVSMARVTSRALRASVLEYDVCAAVLKEESK